MKVLERVTLAALMLSHGMTRLELGHAEWWLWCVAAIAWGVWAIVADLVQRAKGGKA